jgi:hypothetical protein
MDIFALLTLWVYGLACLFCLHAVVTAACTAVTQVTGSTVSDLAYEAYTWVIANPVWAWEIMEKLSPTKGGSYSYLD